MLLTMMKAKLHRATVTQCDLHYEGSISIDKELLEKSGILVNECVDIWNITNGARLSTYAIEAPAGSKTFGVNGAAARYFQVGDRIIVTTFAGIEEEKARQHMPTVVMLDEDNNVVPHVA